MKLFLTTLTLFVSLSIQAQKGFEVRANGGIGFFGSDPWVRGGLLTATALYNFNGTIAAGPTFSYGLGAKTFIESSVNSHPTTVTEIGVLAQAIYLRKGKLKMYGTLSVASLSGKSDPLPDFINNTTQEIELDDSAIGIGFGTGALINLGGGFYFNILDYQLRTVPTDFMDLDKGFAGKNQPMHSFRTGISIVLQGN